MLGTIWSNNASLIGIIENICARERLFLSLYVLEMILTFSGELKCKDLNSSKESG